MIWMSWSSEGCIVLRIPTVRAGPSWQFRGILSRDLDAVSILQFRSLSTLTRLYLT